MLAHKYIHKLNYMYYKSNIKYYYILCRRIAHSASHFTLLLARVTFPKNASRNSTPVTVAVRRRWWCNRIPFAKKIQKYASKAWMPWHNESNKKRNLDLAVSPEIPCVWITIGFTSSSRAIKWKTIRHTVDSMETLFAEERRRITFLLELKKVL